MISVQRASAAAIDVTVRERVPAPVGYDVTVRCVRLDWPTLRAAATQDDAGLAAIYASVLRDAETLLAAQAEAARQVRIAARLRGRGDLVRIHRSEHAGMALDVARTPEGGWGETAQAVDQAEQYLGASESLCMEYARAIEYAHIHISRRTQED